MKVALLCAQNLRVMLTHVLRTHRHVVTAQFKVNCTFNQCFHHLKKDFITHLVVLISCNSDELCLGESMARDHLPCAANTHNVDTGLVLVKGIQHDLENTGERATTAIFRHFFLLS